MNKKPKRRTVGIQCSMYEQQISHTNACVKDVGTQCSINTSCEIGMEVESSSDSESECDTSESEYTNGEDSSM